MYNRNQIMEVQRYILRNLGHWLIELLSSRKKNMKPQQTTSICVVFTLLGRSSYYFYHKLCENGICIDF